MRGVIEKIPAFDPVPVKPDSGRPAPNPANRPGKIGLSIAGVFFCLFLQYCDRSPDLAAKNDARGWGVFFYMPYDNDLSPYTDEIIGQIGENIYANVAVEVCADLADTGGMVRYVFDGGRPKIERIGGENSADEALLGELLLDFHARHNSRRHVAILMNHGGELFEMCHDANPGPDRAEWMDAERLGDELRALAARGVTRELLFLQQCARGTFANLYAFRNTADYVLASALPVGYPNTYYPALLKFLSENASADGREIAGVIAKSDRDFRTYSCYRNSGIVELPNRLRRLTAACAGLERLARPADPQDVYPTSEDVIASAPRYLRSLADVNPPVRAAVAEFLSWIENDLTADVWHSGERNRDPDASIGMFVPTTPFQAAKYRARPFFDETGLSGLWTQLAARPPQISSGSEK